jgi:hypothetical protein
MEARTSGQRALQEAQQVLTPEQWQKVPEQIRSPGRGFGPGGGGPRGGGGHAAPSRRSGVGPRLVWYLRMSS